MATIRCNGNWVQFDSHDNQCFDQDDEQEEESLSLCDLPTSNFHTQTTTSNINEHEHEHEPEPEDFQFGPCHDGATVLSPENLCTADELFFQGQLLPFSCDTVGSARKINRSASMSVVGSRTCRMTDGKDPRMIRSNEYGYGYKPKIRNQFHSHPSPSPQIRTQSFRTISHYNSKTSTSLWSFLQVGLVNVKPQEIGLADLKNRSKRFGSHNSNSSSTSSSMNSNNDQSQSQSHSQGQRQNKIMHPPKKSKKKQRLFFGGCKCSAVSTVGTMKDTVPKKKTTAEESTMIGEGKQTVSRHRTFEWLKQLSLAAPSEA